MLLAPFLWIFCEFDEKVLDNSSWKNSKKYFDFLRARLAPFDIAELRELTSYDEMELDMMGDQRTAMFVIILIRMIPLTLS